MVRVALLGSCSGGTLSWSKGGAAFLTVIVKATYSIAEEGTTMDGVTHEMGFARKVADQVIFMDQGEIVEVNQPEAFFDSPQSERTKLFLSQILGN